MDKEDVVCACNRILFSYDKEKKKEKEILPFATTWVDLEGIMLCELTQTEKDKYCMVTLICVLL